MDDATKSLRDCLYVSGRYHSLPNDLMQRADLGASTKIVWMALVGHLRDDGTEVWPSTRRLAELTGLNRETVLAAIAALEKADLLEVQRRFGGSNIYRILRPSPGLFDRTENPTGRKTQPVGKTRRGGRKTRPEPVGKSDTKYCSTLRSTPPTPPQGGEGAGLSLVTIGERLNTAHVEAIGYPMPPRWRDRLERLGAAAAMFETVTAGDMKLAIAACKDAKPKRAFGFGWVENVLRDKAAAAVAKRAAGKTEAHPKGEPAHVVEARRKAEEAERLQRQAEADHWDTLSIVQQRYYLETAAARRLPGQRSEITTRQLAERMAYRESKMKGRKP